MMAQKRRKVLWWFTGFVALILLLVTLALFVRANQIQESGIWAYIVNSETAPFLRDQPGNNGKVLLVLEYGSAVRINDSATRNNQEWYRVDAGGTTGWLMASLISFDPPETATQE